MDHEHASGSGQTGYVSHGLPGAPGVHALLARAPALWDWKVPVLSRKLRLPALVHRGVTFGFGHWARVDKTKKGGCNASVGSRASMRVAQGPWEDRRPLVVQALKVCLWCR